MGDKTLSEIAEAMRDIDFAMLFTRSSDGKLAGRPMSNNGDVEFDGDSYFFTNEHTHTVRDIEHDASVALSYQGKAGLFGSPPLFIAVEGTAELIRDKAAFTEHWAPGLDHWFEDGVDTPGIVLIKVHAERLHYWDGKEEGDVAL
ncbi:MAG TPA: pyridoxamine 5'-phosphate oxidase family protein [Xanthobacteraceae bacterium]|nr:pyridoxamine 5'-phosphate oxidase family protein [Xanthobacteraceae bacterium]